MKCIYCGNEFKESRKTAKYCSKRCNTYSNRKVSTTVSTTLKIVSVTEPEEVEELEYDDSSETTPAEEYNPDNF